MHSSARHEFIDRPHRPSRSAKRPFAIRVGMVAGFVLIWFVATAFSVRAQEASWTAEVGTLFLKKEGPDPTTLFVAPVTATPLFNASAFDFNHEFGPSLKIVRNSDASSGVEAKFFGIDGWSSSSSFVAPLGANLNSIPPVGFAPGLSVDVNAIYTSELFSSELNYHEEFVDGWWWLIGFRYVELIEEFDTLRSPSVGPGNIADIRINADNYLYGFQIGAEGELWSAGIVRIDGFLKTGLYDNFAKNGLSYVQSAGPDWDNRDSTNHASFLGETGLTGVVQLTPTWALKAGYQAFWLTSVAEATRQPPDMRIVPLPGIGTGLDVSGAPFFHGGQVLLTWER